MIKKRAGKLTTDKRNNPKSMRLEAKSFMNEISADKHFTKETTQYQEDLNRISGDNYYYYQDYSALDNAGKKYELTCPPNTVSDLIQWTESSQQPSQSITKGKELVQKY